MSALPAQSAPAPRRSRTPTPERRLRPAPEPMRRAKPRLVFAIVALAGVALIVVTQLLLSVAYQVRQAQLARQEQKLAEDLDRMESPQYLAMNADALGMVPNANPVLLLLSDGAVVGEPTAATRGAGASGPLVPNSLLDGVPTVTERNASRTPTAGASDEASTAAPRPFSGERRPATSAYSPRSACERSATVSSGR